MSLFNEQQDLSKLSDEQLRGLLSQTINISAEDRKQNQILYYNPVSARAQRFHDSTAQVLAAGGGNRSGKTESMLAHMVMCSTGVFPYSQQHLIDTHFRGPISCRLTVESLTTTLEPTIIPKLQWWRWSGHPPQGGSKGHWGWIPKNCLIDGQWAKSYSTKTRILRLICRNPKDQNEVLGESTWQFMSFDQDASDFASGEFHICAHDEPPPGVIWHENEARVMSVGGRLLLAMTWPDDPAINVDWLYNEVYEPARQGHPNIEWLELWTTDNANIDQKAIALQSSKWSQEIVNVRIYGGPIRFSNRIHPEFTDQTRTWCFNCQKPVMPMEREYDVLPHLGTVKPAPLMCPECHGDDLCTYNHIEAFHTAHNWPTIYCLDPHPRKPHDMLWVQVSPSDDLYVVAEEKIDGDCTEVREAVDKIEHELGLIVLQRLMDPNMGASPSGQRRGVTWQDEFSDAGLNVDLADDSSVGRQRINTMLKPDEFTRRPRLVIHPRCKDTIYQMNRYSWDDYNKNLDRDVKQQPKDKYSDKPSCIKYIVNTEPTFIFLREGGVIAGRGQRVGSY